MAKQKFTHFVPRAKPKKASRPSHKKTLNKSEKRCYKSYNRQGRIMTQKTIIVNGQEVPVLPAKAEEEIINKRTQKKYASKEEFDADVANNDTDTTE
jgi:hypothetical protein